MDSITLVFVIAHFCFLLYVQGHLWALQAREAEYTSRATAYNEKAERVSTDNAKIAEAARQIAAEESKRARIENDTAYQQRKAAEKGAQINAPVRGAQSVATSLSTSPIELEKPEKPKESSTDFLTSWDFWIRLANFGELALAAVTFIYIRNRSAKFNAGLRRRDDDEFPDELDEDVSVRGNAKERADYATKMTTLGDRIDDTHSDRKTTQGTKTTTLTINRTGLKRLREVLKLIAFSNPPGHFKADVRDDYVIIRFMESKRGDEYTTHSAKSALSILDDVLTMEPGAFRARLEEFLKRRGFPLNISTG